MSVDDPLVNGVPLSSLRVVDLKDELDKRGLSKIGNKSVLTERLKTYICENEQQNCGDNTEMQKSPPKVSSPENPLVAAYLARQAETLERQKKDAERIRREKGEDKESAEDTNSEEEPEKIHHEVEEEEASSEKSPRRQRQHSGSRSEGEPMRKKAAKESADEDVETALAAKKKPTTPEETPKTPKKPSPVPKETVKERSLSPEVTKKTSHDMENKEKNPKCEEPVEMVKEEKSKKTQEQEEPVEDKLSEEIEETSQDNDEVKEIAPGKNVEEQKEEKIEEDSSRDLASSASKHAEENGASAGGDHLEELDYGEAEVEAEPDAEDKETKDEVLELDESEERELRRQKRRIALEKETDSEHKGEKKRKISPSSMSDFPRHPESDIIHIRGLTRPFTDRALKAEILKSGGQIVDFWIDSVKSHCIVQMQSIDEAREVRIAMHNTQWPTANPKTLSVQFDTKENMERHRSGHSSSAAAATPAPATRSDRKQSDRERPIIGTLPGRNPSLKITVEAAMRENEKREESKEKERRERAKAEKETEGHRGEKDEKKEKIDEKRHHEDKHSVVSELSLEDIDTKKEDREPRKRHRSETPPFSKGAVEKKERHDSYQKHDHERERDRIRDRERDRERGYERRRDDDRVRHRDERDEEKEKEREEKPVKTADSLFMKTKTLPAIYFLPLTDEEAAERQEKLLAEKKKREQKEQEREKEKEREKEREKTRR